MLESLAKNIGQFPFIQIAIAFLIAVGGLLAIRRGETNLDEPERPAEHEQRWYLDGPIKAIIDTLGNILNELRGIYRVLNEIRDENKDYNAERRGQHKEHMDAVRDVVEKLPRRRG